MKIAIDVTRAVIETAGIGRWTYEITQNLLDQDSQNEYLIFSTHFNDSPQKTEVFESFKRKNVTLKRLKIPGKLKESLWGIRVNFLNNFLQGADVLYAPSYFEVILGLKIPQVVTIHDMTADIFPDQRGDKLSKFLSSRTLEACRKAKFITCVSKSTQKDLIRITKTDEKKTQVIYPGLKIFKKINEKLPLNLEKERYILSVGTIEPRKNIARLLKAYNQLGEDLKREYPLVLVGGRGWNDSEIFSEAENSSLKQFIHFTGYVDDATLAGLYKNAKVFVYPSLYEGFGLPVLEAMSFGCPVITSNVSSMPEVAGEAAQLVDPNNTIEIKESLKKLITDDGFAKKLATSAKTRSQKFSWEHAAEEMLKIFKQS